MSVWDAAWMRMQANVLNLVWWLLGLQHCSSGHPRLPSFSCARRNYVTWAAPALLPVYARRIPRCVCQGSARCGCHLLGCLGFKRATCLTWLRSMGCQQLVSPRNPSILNLCILWRSRSALLARHVRTPAPAPRRRTSVTVASAR